MMLVCIYSTQATVKTISDGLYTPLWCDPVPLTHTHTHDALHAKQLLIQKRQIVIAKLELNLFFFFFFL